MDDAGTGRPYRRRIPAIGPTWIPVDVRVHLSAAVVAVGSIVIVVGVLMTAPATMTMGLVVFVFGVIVLLGGVLLAVVPEHQTHELEESRGT